MPGTGGSTGRPAIESAFEDRRWYGDFLSAAQTDLLDTSIHYRRDLAHTDLEFLASWQDFDTWQLQQPPTISAAPTLSTSSSIADRRTGPDCAFPTRVRHSITLPASIIHCGKSRVSST
ncbi:MAG: hypothetical protein U5K56_13285 [Halioglobus sp.]|nr:hypothetical protein [Halioglobus sp.]